MYIEIVIFWPDLSCTCKQITSLAAEPTLSIDARVGLSVTMLCKDYARTHGYTAHKLTQQPPGVRGVNIGKYNDNAFMLPPVLDYEPAAII